MATFGDRIKPKYEDTILNLSENYANANKSKDGIEYRDEWLMCLLTDYDSFDFKETLNMLDTFKEQVWIECNVQMGFNLDSERKELDEDFDFTKRILNDFLLMRNLLEKNTDLKKEKIDTEQIKRCFEIVFPMADYSIRNKGLYDKDVTKTVSNIEKVCRKLYEKNIKTKKQKDIEL